MTKDADFKALIRGRMQSTGENYLRARTALLTHGAAGQPDSPFDTALREQERAEARLIPKGRIVALPAKRKNIVVILLALLREFTPGVDYPEKQVNDILARFHEDYAYLRRELVDYGYLTRSAGIYRVTTSLPHRSPFQAQEIPAWEREWLPGFIGLPPR